MSMKAGKMSKQNSNLQISLHYDVGEKPLTYVLSQTMTVFDDTIPEHVQRAIDATKKAGGYVTITRITYEEITG